MNAAQPLFAGIELGGTKAIAVLGDGHGITQRATFPTTSPDATLSALRRQLDAWAATQRLGGLGIASFGPIALDPGNAHYGHILPTTKPGWTGVDLVGALAGALPVAIHTDVTAAALAEGHRGAARGLTDHIYVTIGTGIGMGIVAGGHPVMGAMHPEAGHLRVRRIPDDHFVGICPFHGDCLEGLASGPAIAARAGRAASAIMPDDMLWDPIVDALAEGFAALMLTLAPRRIVVGGGVGVGQQHLIPRIDRAMRAKLAGYLGFIGDEAMIVPAVLGGDAGPLGALILAEAAAGKHA